MTPCTECHEIPPYFERGNLSIRKCDDGDDWMVRMVNGERTHYGQVYATPNMVELLYDNNTDVIDFFECSLKHAISIISGDSR